MTTSRLLPVTMIVSCLLTLTPAGSRSLLAAQSQSDAREMLRGLAEQFYADLARKDLDALMALWSSRSPDLAQFKQQMQQLFSAYDRIEIKNIILSKVVIEEARASARVGFEMGAIDARTGKPASGLGRQVEAMRLVKEGDAFRIWNYGPAASDLASSLIAAKTEEERTALLEADKELIAVELRRQLIAQGQAFMLKGDYTRAISAYNIAQSVAELIGDKEGVAWALTSIGLVYTRKADYAVAMDYLVKGLKLLEALGDQPGVLWSLKYIGDVHFLLDNQKEALDAYRKSLALAEATGNAPGTAYALDGIGQAYRQQGDFPQALEYYRKSLAMQEASGNKAGIATSLASIGYVKGVSGDYPGARDSYQKSLSLYESMGDKAGIAYALINLGATYLAQGDYARALECYQRSLTINEALGNKSGIAAGLNYIGIIYRTQGNYAQALEYLQRSLKLNQELGSKDGTAQALNSIGNVRYPLGDYTGALDYFEKSLALYEQLGSKVGIVTELDNIGSAAAGQGDYARALQYLKRSLSLAEAGGLKSGIARSLGNMASVQRARGNYFEALELADRSAALAIQIGSLELFPAARITAGRAYLGLNQPAEARKAFDEAIATIEDLRSRVAGAEQERERFFEGNLYPYQAMVELLVSQGKVTDALSYAERVKGRVLLDVLTSGKVKINKAMTPEEQEQEQRLTDELVSLNTQLYGEQHRLQPNAERLSDLNKRIQKTRLDREAFRTSLYALHPELRIERGEAPPIRVEEAARLISDAKTALLEYVVTPERTYLFALTKSHQPGSRSIDLTVHTIEIGEKELAQQVEQFRQTLANQNYGFQKPAADLYRLLLGPVQAKLNGQSSLVIVPDTVLWSLPFQALQPAEGRFVIEDFAVSYAPSLTVLREMQLVHRAEKQGNTTMALLAVGNPLLGKQTVARAKSVLMDQQFESLPEAERQVRVLGQLYGPSRSKVYVGSGAREDVIKAESSKYEIIQLATHGVLNDASPMYSYVLLSRAEDSATEDGFLEAWEIMDLNLNADLVVLSACETARGRIGAGEGVIGLSWAVFVAGCPTTVVSQWKVESSSTTELMLDFHRNLRAGGRAEGRRPGVADDSGHRLSKAEALRRAQLSLLHSKNYSHPFYWAAFVLMGDGSRPIPR